MKKPKMIVIAGGTGGHIFPALTIAKKMTEQNWQVEWLGTKDRMENYLVPQNNFKMHTLDLQGVQKKLFSLKSITKILKAILDSYRCIKSSSPDVVLAMGSYISFPAALAAWLSKVPLVVHEQNAVAGKANKFICKIASCKLQAFPNSLKNAETVGNPVREDLLNLDDPSTRFNDRKGPLRILVLGGSQGAYLFNKIVPQLADRLSGYAIFWHQTGKLKKPYTTIDKSKFVYKQEAFIHDMKLAYSWSDLVISRSGALTVSELSAVGLGSILVPFEHKDKQQYYNAKILKDAKAALVVIQSHCTVDILAKSIENLDRSKLLEMAKQAKKCKLWDEDDLIVKKLNNYRIRNLHS